MRVPARLSVMRLAIWPVCSWVDAATRRRLQLHADIPELGVELQPVDPALAARYAQVVEEILARTPEHMPEPTLHRVARVRELMGDPQRSSPWAAPRRCMQKPSASIAIAVPIIMISIICLRLIR